MIFPTPPLLALEASGSLCRIKPLRTSASVCIFSTYPSRAFLTFRATDRAVLSWLVARKNLGDLAGTRWEAWCNTRLHQNRGILQRRMSKMPPFVWFSIGAQTEAPDGNQILLCKLGVSTVYDLFWHCALRYFSAGKPISILFLFRCEYLGTWSRFWPSAHMAVVSGECLTN